MEIHLTLSAALLMFVVLIAAIVLVYRFVIKPILDRLPSAAAVQATATTAGTGLMARLEGFKTIIVARLQWASGIVLTILMGFDKMVAPYFADGTVDWKSWFPSSAAMWAIPGVLIAGGLIHEWLRNKTTGPVGAATS